jgi:hypothetical protein
LNPGGGSGREEPPLGIQIPDDARELDRDLLAYRREQRVQRRRSRLRKLTAPFGGTGTVMPLLASILAVCLVAGAMLSVATFSPATGHEHHGNPAATQTAGTRTSATRNAQNSSSAASTTATSATASPSAGARVTARPSSSANSSAVSSTGYRVPASQVRPGTSGIP